MMLPESYDAIAPDGSEVRALLAAKGGSMAHFRLAAGQASRAVRHRTVDEIWFILSGRGEMWRSAGGRDEIAALVPGLCLTIEAGTSFQFRAGAGAPLAAVAVTMPPWPGDDEAEAVAGHWHSPPSSWPGSSGPPMPARAATGGPDEPGHDVESRPPQS
jgi:mannose-6-phosphate isomerase-like protein (cupin superfamily)